MITGAILKQLAPTLTQAKADSVAILLEKICPEYGIDKPVIFNPFIANLLEETGEFSVLVESLNYSTEALLKTFSLVRISESQAKAYGRNDGHHADQQMIANIIYGGTWGLKNLGNQQQGDGWMFRGSGPMQLTGRSETVNFTNYFNTRFGTTFTPEAMADELRANIETGIHSACWFFTIAKKLIPMALAGDFKGIVKKINGGYLNMDKRQAYFAKANELIK